VAEAIEIKGVTKTFGTTVAVNDLDMVVPSGSLCGFIGRNGAGKTTTIRMIMSILFPDTGELSVLGRRSAVESKDRIGYLPEERGLYRKMKVLSFLTYIARLKGVDSGEARRRALNWLERMELGPWAGKKSEKLSKGMQQKVQFISSVIHDPELIILDEPFSGMDPVNLAIMRDLIIEEHAKGKTVIFSTHVMHTAEEMCDHLFMINKGTKVLDASLADIYERYDPLVLAFEPLEDAEGFARLDRAPGVESLTNRGVIWEARLREKGDAPGLMAQILAIGPVRRLELKRPKLDDIFRSLAGDVGMGEPEAVGQD